MNDLIYIIYYLDKNGNESFIHAIYPNNQMAKTHCESWAKYFGNERLKIVEHVVRKEIFLAP